MRFTFLFAFLFASSAWASTTYLGATNALGLAAQSSFSGTAGFGTTSCTLCHTSESGGLNTIAAGFGTAFQAAGGLGGDLNQTQLEAILNNATLRSTDSDSDGITNGIEIAANTNPNSCSSGGGTCPASNNGNGGGCGLITAIPPAGFGIGSLMLFLLAPIFLILGLRKKLKTA